MALSLDDKLLGEKTHYYCSSSEDEGDDVKDEMGKLQNEGNKTPSMIHEAELKEYEGHCTNTGPKGVINDWREYKRLETEKRVEQEKERQALAKKLQITCRSHLDDDKEREKDEAFLKKIEKDIDEFEDEFLKEYRQKRIEEMRRALENVPKFGNVIALTKDDFVDSIDKEKPQVTVIIHVYEDKVKACEAMNGCLICLAQEYSTTKFCKIKATEAKLSLKFSTKGVPALLIYKQGELIGNFIRLSDEFGDEFIATDVESFLQEHGFLPANDIMNTVIRDKTTSEIRGVIPQDEDSGSEFESD
ncbi:hypothetical protein ACJMK2_033657 [Sinanodonta woodiana]|uniref:Phosducin domain-containing protein n=1 Tax=Sinanodonta woodiana TaxID=1069815 RepID=A0ABD3WP12_SINWO